MTNSKSLQKIAELIKTRNRIDDSISKIIERPACASHVGEFVASRIFDLTLHQAATHKGSDGYFSDGRLKGKSVNIKFCSKNKGLLNIVSKSAPDFYLVLTGPRAGAASSRGTTSPWKIVSVFLFHHDALVRELKRHGPKNIGIATSVRRQYWDEAEIYPSPTNASLPLSQRQAQMLQLFNSYH